LWTRNKSEVTDEQYQEFYKNLTHDFANPLAWAHNRVEGSTEYTQLLYIPSKAPSNIFTREAKAGIKLYVKRVFIMDDADNLIPNYLRFVQGVVDSADLPLNVSRELLQESRDVKTIREGNARRILTMLDGLAKSEDEKDQENFKTFYQEFASVLKEGLGEDVGNRERILKLLRFATSNNDQVSTSLSDYKARMKEGQKAIYYVTAESLNAAKNSPQLELFKKKDIEVLLMTERVDEWSMEFVTEFDGTPLQNVAKGAVDLGDLQDAEEKQALEQAAEAFKPVVEQLSSSLKDKTQEVRVTTRLVDSPACLVTPEGQLSPQLLRMLKDAGQPVPDSKPILEINPSHPLVQKLQGSAQFDNLANVIFDQAVIAEGGLPEDPAEYVKRINSLLLA
jgi:molecular chaperone HtpG